MRYIKNFNLQNNTKQIKEYYYEFGYVVISLSIINQKIDKFIDAYKPIRINFFSYCSQSLNIPTIPVLNKYFFIKFSKNFKPCIYDKHISKALSLLSEKQQHVLWQDMLFDQSTSTMDHHHSKRTINKNIYATHRLSYYVYNILVYWLCMRNFRAYILSLLCRIRLFSMHREDFK